MTAFEPQTDDYAARVRESYDRQTAMVTLGAELTAIGPGTVEIVLPFRADLCQQHGFIHAGIITAIADSACGYAAYSLMPADAGVLTVEFKVNFLHPAAGERLIARGMVSRAGRTISVCAADIFAVSGDSEKVVATMLATVMTIQGREGVRG
ncbi:PaaI family thioesterase [Candidatus Gracilibacteria bacterium]|nr:PaaI family thioesterase [Candidatus Gracilibacteria bacterium]